MKELCIVLALISAVSWSANVVRLINCDFKPSYKEEIVYGVGLLPIASVFTVWYDKED